MQTDQRDEPQKPSIIKIPIEHLKKFSKSAIEIFNYIEQLGLKIAFVLALEKFFNFRENVQGQSIIILRKEVIKLKKEIDEKKNKNIEEFQKDYPIYLCILEKLTQLLPHDEQKQELQKLNSNLSLQNDSNAEPEILKYFDSYCLQSAKSLHSLIINDVSGDLLVENIKIAECQFAKFLYFDFQQFAQNINEIKDFLQILIISVVQHCRFSYQTLNDYIYQIDKDEVLLEVQLIKNIFSELSILFNQVEQALQNNSIKIDGQIQINKESIELLLLIYDHFNYLSNQKNLPELQISYQTKQFITDVYFMYKGDITLENIQKQIKYLSEMLQNSDSGIVNIFLKEVTQVCDYLVSSKLKLLFSSLNCHQHKFLPQLNPSLFKFNYKLLKDLQLLQSLSKAKTIEEKIYQCSVNLQQLESIPLFKMLKLSAKIEIEELIESNLDDRETFEQLNQLFKEEKDRYSGITDMFDLIKLEKYKENLCLFLGSQKIDSVVFEKLWGFAESLQHIIDALSQQRTPGGEDYYVQQSLEQRIDLAQMISIHDMWKKEYRELQKLFFQIPKDQKPLLKPLIKQIKEFNSRNQQQFENTIKQYQLDSFETYIEKFKLVEGSQYSIPIDYFLQLYKQ